MRKLGIRDTDHLTKATGRGGAEMGTPVCPTQKANILELLHLCSGADHVGHTLDHRHHPQPWPESGTW